MNNSPKITVQTIVNLAVEKVWEIWTLPEHITQWNFASDEWCCPTAENELKVGGKFNYRMEAKDGSMGFDFEGLYETIQKIEYITYILIDGRKVKVEFINLKNKTEIIETFEAEDVNPEEMQRDGWQAILNNFKKYAESIK